MNNAFLDIETLPDTLVASLKGCWVFKNVSQLEEASAEVIKAADRPVTFECGGLEEIDIAGAWVLYDRSQQLSELDINSEFKGFKAAHFKFLQHIIDVAAIREYVHEIDLPKPPHPASRTRTIVT